MRTERKRLERKELARERQKKLNIATTALLTTAFKYLEETRGAELHIMPGVAVECSSVSQTQTVHPSKC